MEELSLSEKVAQFLALAKEKREKRRTQFRQRHVLWKKGETTIHTDAKGKEYEVHRYNGENVGIDYKAAKAEDDRSDEYGFN